MIAAPQRHRAPVPNRSHPTPAALAGTVIPYDYGATFPIAGRPGNVVQSVIQIANDSVFVATAIGYGFEEERGRPLLLRPKTGLAQAATVLPGDITLGEVPAEALIEGFRFNPRLEPMIFQPGPQPYSNQPLAAAVVRDVRQVTLFEGIRQSADIAFLLSIVDSASGRELQDEPVHNLASLGKSNGERPFRLLAQPVTFLPRATIRLQIMERTPDVRGTLFVVLYGYSMLHPSGCPEPAMRMLRGTSACPVETIGSPNARVIPFDYVVTLPLSGRPRNVVEGEAPINVEGGFVATSIGYGLQVEEEGAAIELACVREIQETKLQKRIEDRLIAAARAATEPVLNLADVPLRLLPPSALTDGIRIRPAFLRMAFREGGGLARNIPLSLVNGLFERLNRPADVSFRYTIFDSGRGRELQNQPLHNVAGLGSADGNRPFKRFARAALFLPRSTVRVRVEEQFGRGILFIAFQGYKVLGAPSAGGRV